MLELYVDVTAYSFVAIGLTASVDKDAAPPGRRRRYAGIVPGPSGNGMVVIDR
jgi:hypothetical protein